MNARDSIQIGDTVQVYFSRHPPITGVVKGLPAMTGDAWKIRPTYGGNIVYIQQYNHMSLLDE